MSPVRSARPLFVNTSENCPVWQSPSDRAYSELAERLRTSPARPSTEPELTLSAPGKPGAPLSFASAGVRRTGRWVGNLE